jgi:hypothetical protein
MPPLHGWRGSIINRFPKLFVSFPFSFPRNSLSACAFEQFGCQTAFYRLKRKGAAIYLIFSKIFVRFVTLPQKSVE